MPLLLVLEDNPADLRIAAGIARRAGFSELEVNQYASDAKAYLEKANGGKVPADIKVDGDTLEASVIDPSSPRIFVNNPARNEVDVINREMRSVEAIWPIHLATRNVAMALDAAGHRLFVACRSGKIVVLDSRTGKELQTLDIGSGVDDLIFDPATLRIYASTGAGTGSTAVYEERDPDHYEALAEVATAPGAKNEVLVPQLDRYFTVVPPRQNATGFVYAYQVNK
jgi:hypothetical protein